MSLIRISVDVNESAASIGNVLNLHGGGDAPREVQSLATFLSSIAGGIRPGNIRLNIGSVRASGTITFTGNPVNNETLDINGVTFTAKTSGATGDQFNIGSGAAANASALAAAINASTTAGIVGTVYASVSAGVITITAAAPGAAGNLIALTESMTNVAVSGANLTGGSDTAEVSLSVGK